MGETPLNLLTPLALQSTTALSFDPAAIARHRPTLFIRFVFPVVNRRFITRQRSAFQNRPAFELIFLGIFVHSK
jgi:hypothetical protein